MFKSNWHIEAIAHALSRVASGETKRFIITLPPRNLKSICASVALPAWFLGHYPSERVVAVSYSDVLARIHANDFRRVVNDPIYQATFPGISCPWASPFTRSNCRWRGKPDRAATPRAQSSDPFARLQIRRFAFPIGLRRAFHQQSGRARHPHDEGQNENLGRFLRPGRRRNLLQPSAPSSPQPENKAGTSLKPSQPLHPNSFSPYPSNKGLGVTSNKGLEVT